MSTYNDNLHNSVISTLQSQELDLKTSTAQYNTAEVTLYYARGASIKAAEKLELAKSDQDHKALLKEKANDNNNIINNLLSSATQANQFMSLSISNAAICAANVQIASTAITRLASDVGGIWSIVNAADFETDISNITNEVYNCVNETAYAAQHASQLSMRASMQTSEVSSPEVLNKAKNTGAQMSNLLQIAAVEYATVSNVVIADNAALASANTLEIAAEGVLNNLKCNKDASEKAYSDTNRIMNQNLKVLIDHRNDLSFSVNFNPINSPFPGENQPVHYYYIFVAKESKKLTFSKSDAENIVDRNESNKFGGIEVLQIKKFDKSLIEKSQRIGFSQKTALITEVNELNTPSPPITAKVGVLLNNVTYEDKPFGGLSFKFLRDPSTNSFSILDTDGDSVKNGVGYVVFVMAVYTQEYKRKINDFEDFLSAPSQQFCLTELLGAVKNIKVSPFDAKLDETSEYFKAYKKSLNNRIKKSDLPSYKVTFNLAKPTTDVEYRCMFLLDALENPSEQKAMKISNILLSHVEDLSHVLNLAKKEAEDIKSLKNYASSLLTKKEDKEKELKEKELNVKELKEKEPKDKKIPANVEHERAIAHLRHEIKQLTEAIDKLTQDIIDQAIIIKKAEEHNTLGINDITKKTDEINGINMIIKEQKNREEKYQIDNNEVDRIIVNTELDFHMMLAEHVSSGNYEKAIPRPPDSIKEITAYISPDTTDNFGNLLLPGYKYMPVILTMSTAQADELSGYKNQISHIKESEAFTFNPGNN